MNNQDFSASKILTVFRRWHLFFIIPFLMVFIATVAYISQLKIFRSEAIVLFESNYIPLEEYFTLLDKFEDQPVQVTRSLLYGAPVKKIVNAVWPETIGNEAAQNGKIAYLRSRNGVQIRFQRDNPQALSVDFSNTDPLLAFKVVKETLAQLVEHNKEVTSNRLQTGVEFLKQEVEKTRVELSKIEQEIVRIRSGLPLQVLEEHDKQFQSIEKILDLAPMNYDIEKNLEKALNFSESVSELEFQLEIAKKEMEQLEADLKSKEYLNNAEDLEVVLNANKDAEIDSLNQRLIAKKQQLSELTSKGFLLAHPDVLAATKEIESINNLKKQKVLNLQLGLNKENEELARLRLEKRQTKKIEDKVQEIQLLNDRLEVTRAYQSKFSDKNITLDDKLKELSERRSKLIELESQKIVASHSYAQMSKRLAVMQRENSIDQDKFGLSVKIVEQPQFPKEPIALAGLPTMIMILAITFGVLFMIASVIAMFDTRVYSIAQLSVVVNKPVLGAVDSFGLRSKALVQRKIYMMSGIGLLAYVVLVWLYYR